MLLCDALVELSHSGNARLHYFFVISLHLLSFSLEVLLLSTSIVLVCPLIEPRLLRCSRNKQWLLFNVSAFELCVNDQWTELKATGFSSRVTRHAICIGQSYQQNSSIRFITIPPFVGREKSTHLQSQSQPKLSSRLSPLLQDDNS